MFGENPVACQGGVQHRCTDAGGEVARVHLRDLVAFLCKHCVSVVSHAPLTKNPKLQGSRVVELCRELQQRLFEQLFAEAQLLRRDAATGLGDYNEDMGSLHADIARVMAEALAESKLTQLPSAPGPAPAPAPAVPRPSKHKHVKAKPQ